MKKGRQKDEFSKEVSNLKARRRIITHCLNGNPVYINIYRPEVGAVKLIEIDKRLAEISNIRLNKVISQEGEQWKPIVGFAGYFVSNFARIKTEYGHLLTPTLGGELRNYLRVGIAGKSRILHRLVAIAFVPNPDNLPEVNHKDLNKLNNRADNLEWCTRIDNMRHASAGGRIVHGSKHRSAKLSEEKARQIRQMFKENPSLNQTLVARKFGLDSSNICRLLNGKYWKHVL